MTRLAPEVFDVADLDAAKRIILTQDDEGWPTERRWETETPWIVHVALGFLDINDQSDLLDLGCGVGRLAKPLIERTGCNVLGLETSRHMRTLAREYVSDYRFVALGALPWMRPPFDAILCIWVLQHIADINGTIADLRRAAKPGARILVVNMHKRAIPTDDGWADDNQHVDVLMELSFRPLARIPLPPEVFGPTMASLAYAAVYEA